MSPGASSQPGCRCYQILRFARLASAAALALGWSTLAAAETSQPCQQCHKQAHVVTAKHKLLTCEMCHSNIEGDKHQAAMDELPPEEMCGNCHPRVGASLKAGPHKQAVCETCHGTIHASFARTDNKACASCHKEEWRSLQLGIHGQLWSKGQPAPLCAHCHAGHNPPPPRLHPLVIVRDDQGRPVLDSGGPANSARTCDGCHDVAWIGSHGYHGKLGVEGPHPLEPSCFLCHIQGASNVDRLTEIASGRAPWSETAALSATGLVKREGDTWLWQKGAFLPDGAAFPRSLVIQAPGNRECGFCHGLVYQGQAALPWSLLNFTSRPPERYGPDSQTARSGVIFSEQRIRDSTLNIPAKETLDRPWDVHIQRRITCDNCHVAPNHPSYAFAVPQKNAQHLLFEPRRLDLGEYLKRPDHRLAPGYVRGMDQGPLHAIATEMRKCEGCHSVTKQHAFLPRPERHLSALECESCHAPRQYAPAEEEVDWTLSPERPRTSYRGVELGSGGKAPIVTGFEPVLLPRKKPNGETKLAPFNLITSWYWVSEENGVRRRVPADAVRRALFAGESYHPDLIKVLDRNGDSQLTGDELELDAPERVAAVAARLSSIGVSNPQIEGEVEAVAIHHGIAPARMAIRACETCHNPRSRVTRGLVLSPRSPPGSSVKLVANSEATLASKLVRERNGDLLLEPIDERQGVYVFGNSHSKAIDIIGILSLAGATLVAIVHGGLRYRATQRRKKAPAKPRWTPI